MEGYLTGLLSRLIEVPTVNPPGREYERCAALLSEELEGLGFEVEVLRIPEGYMDEHYPYAPMHRGYPRPIVFGRLGRGRPVLHFNGHYDVVPVGVGWSLDPFKPVVKGGRIYGRGAADMKGGIAATMAALRWLLEEGFEPRGTLEVAFVPDEETGGVGSLYLLEAGFSRPDYVVIGEPLGLDNVIIGHKGLMRGVVRVFGRQVHGSMPWLGENAFLRASALALKFLELYEPVLRSRKTRFGVDVPGGEHPTINLGGYAESKAGKENIVPGEFAFSFDRRLIPEEDPESVKRELEEYLGRAAAAVGARFRLEIQGVLPPVKTPAGSPLVSAALKCVERVRGVKPRVAISIVRSDATHYLRMTGCHAINYGPGTPDRAHIADEYVEIGELVDAAAVYRCMVKDLLG